MSKHSLPPNLPQRFRQASATRGKRLSGEFVCLALTRPGATFEKLTFFYFKEFSLEEIAEITGIAANTVKVKLFRARKRLADELYLILQKEVNSLL